MARSILTSKYQTTIPQKIRQSLGLKVADEIHWEMRNGNVIVTPASRSFLNRRGSLKQGPDPVTAVQKARQLRGKLL